MKTAALRRAATILAVKGGTLREITVGDCLELSLAIDGRSLRANKAMGFYQLLHEMGVFAPDAPSTFRAFGTTGPAQPGPADRPLRHHLPPGPRRPRRLPGRTPADARPHHPAGPGVQPRRAVLAGPGTPPPRHLLAAPRPRGRRGLEAARPDQDPPGHRARRADQRGPGAPRRWPAQPGRGPRVLPRHRPVGDGRPAPGGRRGRPHARSAPRTWPGRRRSAPASRGWISAPGNGSRSCPRSLSRVNDMRTHAATAPPGHLPAAFPPQATAPHRTPHRPDLGRGPRHRQTPRPYRRGGPGVLDLGRGRDVAPHRDPHRGAHRAVATTA